MTDDLDALERLAREAKPAAAHDDEYDALARQLHESITEGQTIALTAKALRLIAAARRDPSHVPVQYDAGCEEHGGTTERHCASDGHPMPEPGGLAEYAGYLADAAAHAVQHMRAEGFYCEDADNIEHLVPKVRAALREGGRS